MWTYKGIDIFKAGINSSGIKWYAWCRGTTLRADSKASMRELINTYINKGE